MDIVQELVKKVYLGDGVYAYHDGHQVWLTTGPRCEIALEPEVMAELGKYVASVEKKIRDYHAAQRAQEGVKHTGQRRTRR